MMFLEISQAPSGEMIVINLAMVTHITKAAEGGAYITLTGGSVIRATETAEELWKTLLDCGLQAQPF